MRKLLSIFLLIFIINPVYSCPIERQDKDQLLGELCKIGDGKWPSNRLNEMIILTKFESLHPRSTEKGNRIIAELICDYKNFNIN